MASKGQRVLLAVLVLTVTRVSAAGIYYPHRKPQGSADKQNSNRNVLQPSSGSHPWVGDETSEPTEMLSQLPLEPVAAESSADQHTNQLSPEKVKEKGSHRREQVIISLENEEGTSEMSEDNNWREQEEQATAVSNHEGTAGEKKQSYHPKEKETEQVSSSANQEERQPINEHSNHAKEIEKEDATLSANKQGTAGSKKHNIPQRKQQEESSSPNEKPAVMLSDGDSHDVECAEPSSITNPCDEYVGPRQSPININPCGDNLVLDRSPLRFKNIDSTPESMQMLNVGNRAAGRVTWGNSVPTTISGGRLPGTFVFEVLDMHWGANSSYGSEHTVNGYHYSGELHLGFRNIKYGDVEQASEKVDGLAGIAVFFDIHSGSRNRGITSLAESLFEIKLADSASQVASPPSMKQLLPKRLDRYVTYVGSPTATIAAPCWGNVAWIVMLEPVRILERELELLRNLRDRSGKRLCQSSVRALQSVSARKVYTKQRFLRCPGKY